AGKFDQGKRGAVISVNRVQEASDEPRHAFLKSATPSADSGPGRTDLEAGEKFRVEGGAREAGSTALEAAAVKPHGASGISAFEPARAATLDRNPERGTPTASSAQASAAAAAEKSDAVVPNAGPARDISLRLAPDQKTNVEVRLIDRGG